VPVLFRLSMGCVFMGQLASNLSGSRSRLQATITKPVQFTGRGLFHGLDVTATLIPAGAGVGVVFRRVDLDGESDIPATCSYVTTVPRRTVLASSKAATVETVEHLLAALAGLGVDNCIVEINAPEVPAFDGSCRDFCDGILKAGIQKLDDPVDCLNVNEVVTVRTADGRQSLTLRPYLYPCLAVTYHLDYGLNSAIASQVFSAEITPEYFYSDIAAARTFILESEIKALKSMGYGRHLTAKDIVVVGDSGVIDNQLRWANEGVRHKILDCIGDLSLSGKVLSGHVTAYRSGHHLNHELARKLSTINKLSAPQRNVA